MNTAAAQLSDCDFQRLQTGDWQPCAQTPPLSPNEMHIWLIEQSVEADPSILSKEEQARAARFALPELRQRFVQIRSGLRQILGTYLDLPPAKLRFGTGEHGKPHLQHPGSELQFNLSHSGDLALLAVHARHAVGLDLEQVKPRSHLTDIARKMFDPASCQKLEALQGDAAVEAFFQHWTRLEAGVKCTGQGLFGQQRERPTGLFYTHFVPQADYLACLAVAQQAPERIHWLTPIS